MVHFIFCLCWCCLTLNKQLYFCHLNIGGTQPPSIFTKYVCFHLSHLSFKSLAKETYTPHCIYTSVFIRYICQTVVQMSNLNTSVQIKCMYPFPTTILSLNFVLLYCFQYSLTASFFPYEQQSGRGTFSLFQSLLVVTFIPKF